MFECYEQILRLFDKLLETFAKRLFSPPALLANAHLLAIKSALPPSWEQKSLFLQAVSMLCKALNPLINPFIIVWKATRAQSCEVILTKG